VPDESSDGREAGLHRSDPAADRPPSGTLGEAAALRAIRQHQRVVGCAGRLRLTDLRIDRILESPCLALAIRCRLDACLGPGFRCC
jgi:hypothetical protein